MIKAEYDFSNWTSFPSSIKLTNDTENQRSYFGWRVPVAPGKTLTLTFKGKGENQTIHPISKLGTSHVSIDGEYADGRRVRLLTVSFPLGSFNWQEFKGSVVVPSDIWYIRIDLWSGTGLPEKPNIAWFDDLKVYMDNTLIFSNDFTNWNPYIGAGVGGILTAVPAYLITKKPEYALVGIVGALIGAGVGYMTAKPL
jgi:hypothetical protein